MQDFMIGPELEGGYRHAFSVSRQRFRQIDIQELRKNSCCEFDAPSGYFSIMSFGTRFEISYPEGDVRFAGEAEKRPLIPWRLLMLNYFSGSKDIHLAQKWISYKDQPNGGVFYPNILAKVIKPMSLFYDKSDKKILQRALSDLGFIEVTGTGDITRQGYFAPRVPVRVQFWDGDDEIPGAFQILFNEGITDQMHIEDSAALCELIQLLIVKQYETIKLADGMMTD